MGKRKRARKVVAAAAAAAASGDGALEVGRFSADSLP